MDKPFWASIAGNDYKIPEASTLSELTRTLFSYLSSSDSDLRDDIAYTTYANWLKREMYTKTEVGSHVEELLANLEKGIGETDTDSVFGRAFSVLFLAEIVHNDNKKPLLEAEQVLSIIEKGLWYLGAELDPRGHIPVKGWAHALAHTADLMLVLGRNRYLGKDELRNILDAIASKMIHATNHVYIHGEDDRLASAIIEILGRGTIPPTEVEMWIQSFATPDGKDWKGVYVEEDRNRAFQNTRNLLRSTYLGLLAVDEEIPSHGKLKEIFLQALQDVKPY